MLWNPLPLSVRHSSSLSSCKSKLKTISSPLHTDLSFYQFIHVFFVCVGGWGLGCGGLGVGVGVGGCAHASVCVCVCDEMRVSLYLCKHSELLRDGAP